MPDCRHPLGHGRLRSTVIMPSSTSTPLALEGGAPRLGGEMRARARWRSKDWHFPRVRADRRAARRSAHWDWVCSNHLHRGVRRTGRGHGGDTCPGERGARLAVHHWSRGTSKSARRARQISRGSTPFSTGLRGGAAAEPGGQHMVDEQRSSAYSLRNRPWTRSLNSVNRTRSNLRRRRERFVAHPYRIGNVCGAGARPPGRFGVSRS